MMSIETYRANIEFLKDKAKKYPHACQTKVKWPRPEDVKWFTRLDFVQAPLMKEREWRFRTEAEMMRFKQNYTTLDNRV
jgi:hypothetical protein